MAGSADLAGVGAFIGQQIKLLAGIKVGPGRDTSAANDQGVIVGGMVFPFTTPAGSTGSVFIPYTQISDTSQVEQLINSRAAAVAAISG